MKMLSFIICFFTLSLSFTALAGTLANGESCNSNSECTWSNCSERPGIGRICVGGDNLPNGAYCNTNSECTWLNCSERPGKGRVCTGGDKLPNGAYCNTNPECAWFNCAERPGVERVCIGGENLPDGAYCNTNSECAMYSCTERLDKGRVCASGSSDASAPVNASEAPRIPERMVSDTPRSKAPVEKVKFLEIQPEPRESTVPR